MDLRDWLIVVGVIIILGILVDGYRRMHLARKDSLKMSRDMGGAFENTPLDDGFNPELPGGSARVVKPGSDSGESDKPAMESPISETNEEPFLSATREEQQEAETGVQKDEAQLVADRDERIEAGPEPEAPVVAKAGKKKSKSKANAHSQKNDKAASESKPRRPEDQEVIVINVDTAEGDWFQGNAIKELLTACGLDHGEMSIFHRHEEDDLLSPVQFSVANAVEPGYFDPDNMEALRTPGVSFFMSMPGPKDYMKAFDFMLETAQCFAKNLKGELKDENRSVMTTQTIEHCRQRVREFERKQLSKSRA